MDLFALTKDQVCAALRALIPHETDLSKVTVDQPRDAAHGDLATNAALVVAKALGRNPRALAQDLAQALTGWELAEEVKVAGPGFVNLTLKPKAWHQVLFAIADLGESYGHSHLGEGQRLNVEYVSANPTGPLHMGHARGAVVGDVLACLLAAIGFEVTCEYYVNDAGKQVQILAQSVHLRYRELFGERVQIPDGHYPGAYLIEVAQALKARDAEKWLHAAHWQEPVQAFAIEFLLNHIRADLASLKIKQTFVHEATLVAAGQVEACLQDLDAKGLLYTGFLEPPKGKRPDDWEPREQVLFKATQFGDEVDRPLQKSDGSSTYFANDIAYHRDKYARTQGPLIDIWGEDHKGYIQRLQAATRAVTDGAAELEILTCALVKVLDNGVPIKMSKRAGSFITLREVLDRVGPDALRFTLLTRKITETLDFDVAHAAAQRRDNPVFYVQYAHARTHSLRHQVEKVLPKFGKSDTFQGLKDLSLLTKEDLEVVKQLALWPKVLEAAAVQREPHRVAFYLSDLATAFNTRWSMGRDPALKFILEDHLNLTAARLFLVEQVAVTLRAGLALMGVEPLKELRDDTTSEPQHPPSPTRD